MKAPDLPLIARVVLRAVVVALGGAGVLSSGLVAQTLVVLGIESESD